MPNNFGYNANVPFASDYPGNDQPPMLQNTQSISSLISIDHVGFNTPKSGIHNQCTFPNKASPPSLGDGDGVLYANNPTGNTWPFWVNSLVGSPFQIIGDGINVISNNGSAFIPGGLIIKWGFSLTVVQTQITFTIPFPNNIFTVYTTLATNVNVGTSGNPGNMSVSIAHPALALDKFTVKPSNSFGNNQGFYWLALGN